MVRWFNRIFEIGKLPRPLKTFLVTIIPKLEQAKLTKGFKLIAIGSIIIRIFSGILNVRISQVETSGSQRGFKAGIEGCTLNCRILSDAIKRAIKERRTMSYSFIDLKKAFDSVNHLKLIEVLNNTGIPRKITKIVANMYRCNRLYL